MTAVKLASLRTDLKREEKGDWIAYPDWPGVEFNVSSLQLPAYAAARASEVQRLNLVHKGNIPPDILTASLGELMAQHLLHDWKGLDVPYSPAKASEVMSDPSYRAVINAVTWCANEISQVAVQFVERDVKNSGKPSASA